MEKSITQRTIECRLKIVHRMEGYWQKQLSSPDRYHVSVATWVLAVVSAAFEIGRLQVRVAQLEARLQREVKRRRENIRGCPVPRHEPDPLEPLY